MQDYPEKDRRFDKFATAIGRVCINWSLLEFVATMCLRGMLGIRACNNSITEPALHCFEFREILQAMKVAGFQRQRLKGWYDLLEAQINYIDNTLRPERNRCVHDAWEPADDLFQLASRTNYSPKIVRPQSFKRELQSSAETQISAKDIRLVANEIDAEVWFMLMVCTRLRDCTKEDVQELQKAQPKRLLAHRLSERQHQPGKF